MLVGDAHANVRVRGCAATAGRPLRTTSCQGDVLHRLPPGADPSHVSSVNGRITWLSSPAGPWNIAIE